MISGTVSPAPGASYPLPAGTRVHLLKPDHSLFGKAEVIPADGAYAFQAVPPGIFILRAIPATDQVILHVTPLAALPHQRHADVLRYGCAVEVFDADGSPIEERFNQDVLIAFRYIDAELIANGVNESHLKPAYFSTTTDPWTIPDSYVVD